MGKTYTVTGPAAVSHAEIVTELGDAVGRAARFESIPPEAFLAALTGTGVPEWQAEGLVEDYGHYDRGEASAVSPDVAQVTGTSPRSVRDFAHDYSDAFQSA